jgi:transposase
LRCWRGIVNREGYEALRSVEYGRKYASMGRPKKKEPETELEKLQRENELLRAENAYLKKLRALMTERERLAKKTKP